MKMNIEIQISVFLVKYRKVLILDARPNMSVFFFVGDEIYFFPILTLRMNDDSSSLFRSY